MACARCGCGIRQTEDFITLNKVWHRSCFTCYKCSQTLDKNTAKIFQGELFCECCYCKIVEEFEVISWSPTRKPCTVVSSPSCTFEKRLENCEEILRVLNGLRGREECKSRKKALTCPRKTLSCSCLPDSCSGNTSNVRCYFIPIPREVASYYNRGHMRCKPYRRCPPDPCCPTNDAPYIIIRPHCPKRSPCRPRRSPVRCPSPPRCCCPKCKPRPTKCTCNDCLPPPCCPEICPPPKCPPKNSCLPKWCPPSCPPAKCCPPPSCPPSNSCPPRACCPPSCPPKTCYSPVCPPNPLPKPCCPKRSPSPPPCCRVRCGSPCRKMPPCYTSGGSSDEGCNCSKCRPRFLPTCLYCGKKRPCYCKTSQIREACSACCVRCGQRVYAAEKIVVSSGPFHSCCFSCYCCNKCLDVKNVYEGCGEIYCKQCYNHFFGCKYYGFGGPQCC